MRSNMKILLRNFFLFCAMKFQIILIKIRFATEIQWNYLSLNASDADYEIIIYVFLIHFLIFQLVVAQKHTQRFNIRNIWWFIITILGLNHMKCPLKKCAFLKKCDSFWIQFHSLSHILSIFVWIIHLCLCVTMWSHTFCDQNEINEQKIINK